MLYFLTKGLSYLAKILNKLLFSFFSLFPDSPFGVYSSFIDKYDILKFLNYFIPFDVCAEILTLWIAALTIFYGMSLVKKVINLATGKIFSGINILDLFD